MTRILKLLILAGLVNVSMQQRCTTESFETNAANTTEEILQIQNVSIIRIFYNCLSPASPATNDAYTSMSVSVFYISSDQPRDIRYNVKCESDQWFVVVSAPGSADVMTGNVTRVDCASCLDQIINDDHCTRKLHNGYNYTNIYS